MPNEVRKSTNQYASTDIATNRDLIANIRDRIRNTDLSDKLELTTVFEHGKLEKHKIEVEIEECADVKNPFNLVSVILAE